MWMVPRFIQCLVCKSIEFDQGVFDFLISSRQECPNMGSMHSSNFEVNTVLWIRDYFLLIISFLWPFENVIGTLMTICICLFILWYLYQKHRRVFIGVVSVVGVIVYLIIAITQFTSSDSNSSLVHDEEPYAPVLRMKDIGHGTAMVLQRQRLDTGQWASFCVMDNAHWEETCDPEIYDHYLLLLFSNGAISQVRDEDDTWNRVQDGQWVNVDKDGVVHIIQQPKTYGESARIYGTIFRTLFRQPDYPPYSYFGG
jgi:hypothetical protein